MKKIAWTILGLSALVTLTPSSAAAQRERVPTPDDELCDDYRGDRSSRYERYCEVREHTMQPPRGTIRVDGHPNGGITVVAWNRNEVLVRARVGTRARDEDDAVSLAEEIEVDFEGRISADGPRTRGRESWHVSFTLFVPRQTDLDLDAVNGGISIYEVSGDIDFSVTNGGAGLYRLGGDVRGHTTNGGLDIELSGDSWNGRGLDVETTNGGVEMWIPDGYNADLETGTVNGGINIDFPITVQGRLGRRRLTTELGDGGPLVRATTTNGGVRIRRL